MNCIYKQHQDVRYVKVLYISDTNIINHVSISVEYNNRYYTMDHNKQTKRFSIYSKDDNTFQILHDGTQAEFNVTPSNAMQKLKTFLAFL